MGISNGKCTSTARLDGKIAIITGANTGIGKTTAIDLFKRGALVILACRNLDKTKIAAEEIERCCKEAGNVGKLEIAELNLSSFNSVRNCASQLLEKPKIDILINNAGVMCCPYEKTEDGNEMQLQTNHLGHFLLTMLLMPKITASPSARIINVSSRAHTRGHIDFEDLNWTKRKYKSLAAYEQSKLCNVLFTKELTRRLQKANITTVNTYCLHPGVIATELGRHFDKTYFPGFRWILRFIVKFFLKTPEEGAQTTIYCAVDEQAGKETGLYYSDCKVKKPSKNAENLEDAEKIWNVSMEIVKLEKDPLKFKLN